MKRIIMSMNKTGIIYGMLLLLMGATSSLMAGSKKCPFTVNPKSGTVCNGGSITFDALKGNSGKKLRLVTVSQPVNGGTVTVNRKCNTFTYTAPELAPVGCSDSFVYTLRDCSGEEKTAPVTITITCCTEFIVEDKHITVAPQGATTFSALEGNSGCNLSLVSVTQPVNGGTASADTANALITYTAPSDPSITTDQFTYTMEETCPTQQKTGTVFVTIGPCTVPMEVNPKSGLVAAGASISFDALEGNSGCNLHLVCVADPTFGTITTMGDTFTYTAHADAPTGAVDTFIYKMEAQGVEMCANVQVRIINVPFVVNPLRGIVCAGACIQFDTIAPNSGVNLSLVEVTPPPAEQGEVVCDCEHNTFVYRSAPDLAEGTVVTFSYTMQSGVGGPQQSAQVTVTIINEAFIINPLTLEVCPLEKASFDITTFNNGCNLKLVEISPAQFGMTEIQSGTMGAYTAPAVLPEGGLDTFDYVISSDLTCDVLGEKVASTEQAVLQAQNAPFMVDPVDTGTATVTIFPDRPFIVNPFTRTVAPGDIIILRPLDICATCNPSLVSVTQPCPDSTGRVPGTVTPNFDDITFSFAAADIPVAELPLKVQFEYTLQQKNEVKTACVTLWIVNDPFIQDPVAGDVCPGGTIVFHPLDAGSGGNRIIVDVGTPTPNVGTVELNRPNGTLTFHANANAVPGTVVTFPFTVALKRNLDIDTVGIATVTIKNVELTAKDITTTMGVGDLKVIDPLLFGTGCNRTLLSVTRPSNGLATVTINPDGTFTIRTLPDTPVDSTITFTYTMTDIGGQPPVTATVTVNVVDVPFVVPDLTGTVCPGGIVTFDTLAVGSGIQRILYDVTEPTNPGYADSVTPRRTAGLIDVRAPLVGPTPQVLRFTYTMQSGTIATGVQRKTGNIKVTVLDVPFVVAPIHAVVCPKGSTTVDAFAVGTGCDRTMVAVTQPPAGLGTVTPHFDAGTFAYTDTSANGLPIGTIVPFTYTVVDGSGNLKTATVDMTVVNCECTQVTRDAFVALYTKLILNK